MMNPQIPIANPDGPALPQGAVPPAAPPPHIPPAPPAQGAVQQPAAPAPRRSRNPVGPIPAANHSNSTGAPAMLELGAAFSMYTEQRRGPNFFVPDAQMLFHVLGLCDHMMLSTDRFTRTTPAWLPIVSQLYIAVLWNVMILQVFVTTNYGASYTSLFEDLFNGLQIRECLIPGPLVPFFQSLAAINGPFDWIGDILPGIPDFSLFWNANGFHVNNNYVRSMPCPAIILDQLHYFATWQPGAENTLYGNFEWYRNIFNQGTAAHNYLNRMGPQLCGSLFATQTQTEAARAFWNSALAGGITRTDAANGPLTAYLQLFGFIGQDLTHQVTWFQHVATVMQKYSQYFNGSVPLKSVSPVGLGAVCIVGEPEGSAAASAWIYPPDNGIEPFRISRFAPRREIPTQLNVTFRHSDHQVEQQAEQYAITTHTNMRWSNVPLANARTQITDANLHHGDYWTMVPYRFSPPISMKIQYTQVIASRYHQQAANRVD